MSPLTVPRITQFAHPVGLPRVHPRHHPVRPRGSAMGLPRGACATPFGVCIVAHATRDTTWHALVVHLRTRPPPNSQSLRSLQGGHFRLGRGVYRGPIAPALDFHHAWFRHFIAGRSQAHPPPRLKCKGACHPLARMRWVSDSPGMGSKRGCFALRAYTRVYLGDMPVRARPSRCSQLVMGKRIAPREAPLHIRSYTHPDPAANVVEDRDLSLYSPYIGS
ncbi:hypothetical protein BJV74DRAFT_261795 [Russula compacta]|nr:hypothetical protein BJV74DRAFT_261795 [Russula compacta]